MQLAEKVEGTIDPACREDHPYTTRSERAHLRSMRPRSGRRFRRSPKGMPFLATPRDQCSISSTPTPAVMIGSSTVN
jgi:hypothetical protein